MTAHPHLVVISLGSNIDAQRNIPAAIRLLGPHGIVLKVSSLTQTAPLGYAEQNDFTNGAVLFKTTLDQVELLKELKAIESELGRVRTENKNGPRTIDLDIVVWDEKVMDPDVYQRDFLKAAIHELDASIDLIPR